MATLASAALSESERRALDRLVERLEDEFGDDLEAVWLYGSRARGDARADSDIDMVVVTAAGQHDDGRVRELLELAAEAEGLYWMLFSVRVVSPAWIAERRAVEAFFLKEVDRDKIVLKGGEVEAPDAFTWHEDDGPVRRRTLEYLVEARRYLDVANRALPMPGQVVSNSYEAVLSAARAALSEEDLFTRTHGGTWHLAHESLVRSDKIDAELHARAAGLQAPRENAVYGPSSLDAPWIHATVEDAEAAVETAAAYLRAVEKLLGAEGQGRVLASGPQAGV